MSFSHALQRSIGSIRAFLGVWILRVDQVDKRS